MMLVLVMPSGPVMNTSSERLKLYGEALDRAYILAMKRGDEVHQLDERDLIAIAAEARRSPNEPTFTFVPASTPAD